MAFEYCAMIVGGLGPDVWDKEVLFTAADFMGAARAKQLAAGWGNPVSLPTQTGSLIVGHRHATQSP